MNEKKCTFTYNDSKGGVFCDKYFVTPGVSQIFRRQALIEYMNKYIKARGKHVKYLEIGCGTGSFCYEAFIRGADVSAYDLNWDANRIVDEIYNSDKKRFTVLESLSEADYGKYNIVGAYEVLEHIEDDVSMLRTWGKYLCPDGILMLTVPGRMKLWNFSDELGGHFRRYEREELFQKLTSAGFHILDIACVGFPFTNVIRPLTTKFVYKKRFDVHKNESMQERTLISGIDKSVDFKYKNIVPWRILRICSKIQKPFWNCDWGYNYVVAARKNR